MEESLTALLLDYAPLTALIGGRVTWSVRDQGGALPAVVLNKISGAPVYSDEGETGLFESRVQVDAYGLSYKDAKSVARAVQARLSGLAATNNGVEFQAVFVDSEQDLFESNQDGLDLYRNRTDFLIHHSLGD